VLLLSAPKCCCCHYISLKLSSGREGVVGSLRAKTENWTSKFNDIAIREVALSNQWRRPQEPVSTQSLFNAIFPRELATSIPQVNVRCSGLNAEAALPPRCRLVVKLLDHNQVAELRAGPVDQVIGGRGISSAFFSWLLLLENGLRCSESSEFADKIGRRQLFKIFNPSLFHPQSGLASHS
jgi:hypothetical protein